MGFTTLFALPLLCIAFNLAFHCGCAMTRASEQRSERRKSNSCWSSNQTVLIPGGRTERAGPPVIPRRSPMGPDPVVIPSAGGMEPGSPKPAGSAA